MQATAEEAGEHATIKRARQALHRRMKICVKDGRVLVGDLLCLDQQGNIILGNTCEQISSDASGQDKVEERNMGLVLVPRQHRVSAHFMVVQSQRKDLEEVLAAT